jgi:hypothetical protein
VVVAETAGTPALTSAASATIFGSLCWPQDIVAITLNAIIAAATGMVSEVRSIMNLPVKNNRGEP